MPTITELFHDLAHGELSNTPYADDPDFGAIREKDKAKVVHAVNEGLTRLHTRFQLRTKSVIIEQREGITTYHLDSRFAESNWTPLAVGYPYIKDLSGERFVDDVLQILTVSGLDGKALPLNDLDNPRSVFTPTASTLQVPKPVWGEPLAIVYKAKHPVISASREGNEIFIHDSLMGALKSYVAFKLLSQMGSQEQRSMAGEYLSMYENICGEVTATDVINNTEVPTLTKFNKRGFV